ncbi:MAG: phosphotransferase [Candidatus Poribacteria bacterium]|nr:phosphotransferase [Candidatus Poribacteria bacterium]
MSSHLSIPLDQSIRQNYALNIESAMPIGTGAMSTTVKLITDLGTLFLKIYKSARNHQVTPTSTCQRMAFTHAVQDFLHQNDFPVPRLLPNINGETLSVCHNQIYAISEFIEGREYEVENSDQLRTAGEMLGRLHQRLRWFHPHIQPAWQFAETEILAQLEDRFSRIQSVVANRKTHPVPQHQIEEWRHVAKELVNVQLQRPTGQFSRQWIIHGDYRAQNLKFDGERICAILDLDTARPANRLYDLGYAMAFFPAVYQSSPLTTDQQSIFLHAYESVSPLSDAEREMLPVHLRLAFLRGITLWLELYYFAGMSERTGPWLQEYLQRMDSIVAFWRQA